MSEVQANTTTSKTFKEKYVDLKWDSTLLLTLVAEFFATLFFIALIMNLPALNQGLIFNALFIAFAAAAIIFAFGPRCGAPFNPCIVLGLMVGGKINLIQGLLYIIIEFLAGLTACGLFLVYAPRLPDGGLAGGLLVVKPGAEATNTAAVFMEMFCAFILVTVVFRTAAGVKEPRFVEGMDDKQLRDVRHKKRQVYIKKHYAPIAIGFTLGFLAFVSSYVSGGAYNPARALGGCVVGTDCSDIWIYFIGDFVGGALAGLFHYWFFEIPHTEASDELADAYDADYCGL